jgi:hypothetical protein
MTVCSKDRISIPFFVLCIGLFLLASCRKNEDTVGSDFIGARVGFDVQSSDTSSVVAYTTLHDSVLTYKLSYFILGNMNDPQFGVSRAAISTQVDLPEINFPSFSGSKIDSIVLQLPYATSSSVYGNKFTTQVIKVYELNENLVQNELYSSRKFGTNPISIGTWSSDFTHLADSVPISLNGATVMLPPHIRIKLDETNFLNKIKTAAASNYTTSEVFKSFLKGFYISPELSPLSTGQGAMTYINMARSTAAMVIYYNDSLKAEFPISGSSTLKGNSYFHTFSNNITIQPALGGTHQNTCYIQPTAGLKTRILFPYLFDFAKDKNIAITGAEIVVSIDQTQDTSIYKLPTRLLLNASDSLGTLEQPIDLFTLDGIAYYGGYYKGNGEYSFNIQRQVQFWFNRYKNSGVNANYGLNLIVPSDNPVGANRAVLDTRAGKVKLKLSYTVIK